MTEENRCKKCKNGMVYKQKDIDNLVKKYTDCFINPNVQQRSVVTNPLIYECSKFEDSKFEEIKAGE